MKNLLLTTLIALSSFGIEASTNGYLSSYSTGSTVTTYGNVGGNNVNITTNSYGNSSSTYGSVGSLSLIHI